MVEEAASKKQAEYDAIRERILGKRSPSAPTEIESIPDDPNKPLTSLQKLSAHDFSKHSRPPQNRDITQKTSITAPATSHIARGPDNSSDFSPSDNANGQTKGKTEVAMDL